MSKRQDENAENSAKNHGKEILHDWFHRYVFYLDARFKRDLRIHRWRWWVPRVLDEAVNPVLKKRPDAFDRVLNPDELDEIIAVKDYFASMKVSGFQMVRIGQRERAYYWQVLHDVLGAKKAMELRWPILDFAERMARPEWESDRGLAEQQLRWRWRAFPSDPSYCAGKDDLGERGDIASSPSVITCPGSTPEDSSVSWTSKSVDHWPMRKGEAIVRFHSEMKKDELNEVLRRVGLMKRGGRKDIKPPEMRARAMALRWLAVGDQGRADLKERWSGSRFQIIALDVNERLKPEPRFNANDVENLYRGRRSLRRRLENMLGIRIGGANKKRPWLRPCCRTQEYGGDRKAILDHPLEQGG